jgi:hypothetical protein
LLATILSPAFARDVTSVWTAAIPDANENPDSVPSSSATSRSKASNVGLPYPLVYV